VETFAAEDVTDQHHRKVETNLRGEIWKVICKIEQLKLEMVEKYTENKGGPVTRHIDSVVDRRAVDDRVNERK